ncbi:MAG: 16S rRNA (cytosine(1402)-N(4))-methyltransferase RsmH [Clostridiales bacterium]|jgi:16S rRNA (cytosine1402-N4)-methyltransferase|nr:16S rRNA (cytosine(1402)-N(4))-methyltransferase RsmH [Clostridiales bacterium]
MEYKHIPVMLKECIDGLNIKPGGIYFDGTLGGGGHSLAILERLDGGGRLIAVDRDGDALTAAGERLKAQAERIDFIRDDFKNAETHLDGLKIDKLDGVLLDLGVSSYQIDTAERGFSYKLDCPLDMRMDRTRRLTAFNVVNEYPESELIKIFFNYGEERFSKRIAGAIAEARQKRSIRTTGELAEIIKNAVPAKFRYADGNPCKRVFQSVRLEVNSELDGLYESVISLAMRLKPGGRIAVISFHSLEDRQIKRAFKFIESDCVCEKGAPVCNCGKASEGRIVTKKPLTADADELKRNPRAESAKLRILERK